MEQEIYQKEFSIGRIIKEAWKIYRNDFKTIFQLTVAVGAGKFLMVILMYIFAPLVSLQISHDVLLKFAQGLDALIGLVLTLAVAWMVKMRIDGQAADFSRSLAKGFSCWTPAILTDLLKCAIFLGPFFLLVFLTVTQSIMYLSLILLLFIPAIIWAVYWFFSTYVVLFHGKSGMAALAYSKTMVKDRAGTVFGYAWVLGFLISVISGLVALPVVLLEKPIEGLSIYVSVPAAFLIKFIIEVISAYYDVALAIFFINFDATKDSKNNSLKEIQSQIGLIKN